MKSLAADGLGWSQNDAVPAKTTENPKDDVEGNLRATGESKIEKLSQDHAEDDLAKALSLLTERVGFEPTVRTSRTQHFQCCSFSHSDTSPGIFGYPLATSYYVYRPSKRRQLKA